MCPSVVPLSELDVLQGRLGIGIAIVSSDRFQDLQQFVAVAGAVQESGSKVKGHGKFVLGFAGSL